MSIHISNKLISNRGIVIVSIFSLFVALIFVLILMRFQPDNKNLDLSEIGKFDKQFLAAQKNKVLVTDKAIFNITKLINKDSSLELVNFGNSDSLNLDFDKAQENSKIVDLSAGFISVGNDSWNNASSPLLDLSKQINIKPVPSKIKLNFGDVVTSNSQTPQLSSNEYSFLFNSQNIKPTIESISTFLSTINPKQQSLYSSNSEDLIKQLELTLSRHPLEDCKSKSIVTNNSALNYLKDEFEVSIFDNLDLLNVSPNQTKFIKEFMFNKNAKSLYIDKKIPIKEYNEIKSQLGVDIFYLDYYNDENVLDTLKLNLDILKKGQGC